MSYMHRTGVLSILAGLALLTAMVAFPTLAAPPLQGINLLQNPSFEQELVRWGTWWYENIVYDDASHKTLNTDLTFSQPFFMPSEPKWDRESNGKEDGRAAGKVSGVHYIKFRGGFYQTVYVPPGSRVRFSVWVNSFCEDEGQHRCPVILRAGINPDGGANWRSSNIRWVDVEIGDQQYQLLTSPEVQVGPSGLVTVFTWGEPRYAVIYTAAYFDQASLIVTVPPTPTGAAPTEPPPSPTPVPCAQMRLMSDIVASENSPVAPSARVVRTWRIQNSGTCPWSGALVFIGNGDQMEGASPTVLPEVDVGQTMNVSLNLVAPAQPGSYQGTWEAHTNDGIVLGRLVVKINVVDNTPTPIPTFTAAPPVEAASSVTETPEATRSEPSPKSAPPRGLNTSAPSVRQSVDNATTFPLILATTLVLVSVISLAFVAFKRRGF
jgi:hypothetical protein